MTPEEVKNFYGSTYKFNKITGMSASTLLNWINNGFVPEDAQYKLERITAGRLTPSEPMENEYSKPSLEEAAFTDLKGKIVKSMFAFSDKYSKSLYPQCHHIMARVLSDCLREAQHQVGEDK